MNKNKTNAIFYLDLNTGFYYAGIQPMLTLAFPPDTISDQEVLSREKLTNLVAAFVETNKIEPSNLVIVFAPTLSYQKDYEGSIPLTEKDNQDIRDFFEIVPFENVASKTYKLGKKTIALAVNKDILDSLKEAFEKWKFTVIAAVPYAVISEIIPELAQNVDFDLMFSRFDPMRQYNMIDSAQPQSPGRALAPGETEKPKNNTRTFALLGVFGLLFAVLLFMVLSNYVFPKKQNPGINNPSRIPLPTASLSNLSPGNEATGDAKVIPIQTATSSQSAQ